MKDPAFLLYSADWLIGASNLTMEERGQYITLLCMQHQKGHLSEREIGLYLGLPWVSCSIELREKFTLDNQGCFYNERLEGEVNKRVKFSDKQRVNGSKGGRPKTQIKPTENPKDNPDETLSISSSITKTITKVIEEEPKVLGPTCFQILELYHGICVDFPKVIKLTESRKTKVKARLKELPELANWEQLFRKASTSEFLKGNNDRGWKCDFDFIVENDKNYLRILEGKYHNTPKVDVKKYVVEHKAARSW